MPAHMFLVDFKDNYGYGWTERYFLDDSYYATQLTPQAIAFYFARNAFLANDCELQRIRVSSGAYKNPVIIQLNPNPGSNTGALSGPATQDFTRLQILWKASLGYGRTFFGGVPQTFIVGDQFKPTAVINTPLNAFKDFMRNGAWSVLSTISAGKPERIRIATLQTVTPKGYVFTATTGDFAVGDVIRVTGASTVGYNGIKTVVNVMPGATDQVYVGGGSPSANNNVNDITYAAKENPVSTTILEGIVEGVTRRAAGRVFGQRRGRRASTVALRR